MNPRLVIGCATLGIVLLTFLTMSLLANNPEQDWESPSVFVERLDKHAKKGQWKDVHRMMDYRWKGRDMVTDLWDSGDEASREDLVAMLQSMFKSTWQKIHAMPEFQNTELEVTTVGPNQVMVEQNNESGTQGLRYWLENRDGEWIVLDRTIRTRDTHNEVSGRIKVIRKRIRAELGGAPLTLSDFSANAPSWTGRVRARTFKVGTDGIIPQ